MGAYMVYLFIPEDTLLVIPQKEVYSWSTTSEPSKFRYSCTTGFIQRASIPPLGGAPYECSDGSRVKSIRELSVKCKT